MTRDYDTEEEFDFHWSHITAAVDEIFDSYNLTLESAVSLPPPSPVLAALVAAATVPSPSPDLSFSQAHAHAPVGFHIGFAETATNIATAHTTTTTADTPAPSLFHSQASAHRPPGTAPPGFHRRRLPPPPLPPTDSSRHRCRLPQPAASPPSAASSVAADGQQQLPPLPPTPSRHFKVAGVAFSAHQPPAVTPPTAWPSSLAISRKGMEKATFLGDGKPKTFNAFTVTSLLQLLADSWAVDNPLPFTLSLLDAATVDIIIDYDGPSIFEDTPELINFVLPIYDSEPEADSREIIQKDSDTLEALCSALDVAYNESCLNGVFGLRSQHNNYFFVTNDNSLGVSWIRLPSVRLRILNHVRTAYIFEINVHVMLLNFAVPGDERAHTAGDNIIADSRTNLFEEEENDGDNIIYIYIVVGLYLSFN